MVGDQVGLHSGLAVTVPDDRWPRPPREIRGAADWHPHAPVGRTELNQAAVCAFSPAAPVTRRYAAGPVSAEASATTGYRLGQP